MDTKCSYALLLAALAVLLTQQHDSRFSGQLGVLSAAATAPLDPHYELLEGTEVVWQKPQHELQGVIVAFHGCSHGAVDWWPADDDCTQCLGLPVEVNITKTVLSHGYALVAISSRDRQYSKCWAVPRRPDSHTVDTRSVSTVLPMLLQREQMSGVPVYALGASSGGAFALILPWYIPIAGVCCQIMALPTDMYTQFLDNPPTRTMQPAISSFAAAAGAISPSDASEVAARSSVASEPVASSSPGNQAGAQVVKHPPVMFVHMPRDQHTAHQLAEIMEFRKQKGLISHVIEVKPRPITVELLESLIPSIAAQSGTADQLVAALKQQKIVDDEGMLMHNPRSSDWQSVVSNSNIPGLSTWDLTPDKSALPEVLNVAWASHEIIHDTTVDMLDWFEEQQQLSL